VSDLTGFASAATAIGSAIEGVLTRVWPTPEQRASADAIRMKSELEAAMAPIQAQLSVAAIEAANPSMFVAGGRPAIIWVGALALFCQYGVGSLIEIGIWAYLCVSSGHLQPRPDLGIGDMMALVAPMLGVSWLRSQDKRNNVATQRTS
jgi:hypothetical protein